MHWLITGGCGFIGTNLIRALSAEGGHAIRVVDDLSVGTREDLRRIVGFHESQGAGLPAIPATGIELVAGDILDSALMQAAARGADVLVHLAANCGVAASVADPMADCRANVIGTLTCLEAARNAGVGRFVLASSGAAVGECAPPIHEEIPSHPVSPYGASKLAGEGYCSVYWRTYGLQAVALRFGNVYGPGSGRKTSVVAKFIARALAGDPLEIYGDGHQTRDFIYIDDLVRAVCLAATVPGVGGEVFQIATARETSVGELVEHLMPFLRDAGAGDVAVHHKDRRPGDVLRNFSDTTKARRLLGWQAETSLDVGLRRTVDWFLGSHRVVAATRPMRQR